MTTTERPTPETDGIAQTIAVGDFINPRKDAIQLALDHARRLERERDEAREQLKHMLSACDGMLEIVEGVRSDRWHYDGFRLKDTPEWVGFYVAARRAKAKGSL